MFPRQYIIRVSIALVRSKKHIVSEYLLRASAGPESTTPEDQEESSHVM